jgi:hypothetical protein
MKVVGHCNFQALLKLRAPLPRPVPVDVISAPHLPSETLLVAVHYIFQSDMLIGAWRYV